MRITLGEIFLSRYGMDRASVVGVGDGGSAIHLLGNREGNRGFIV